MLDSFLNVAYVHETREQQEKEAIALLKQLPTDDLRKLASGEKLAWGCPVGGSESFLDKFRGSPLLGEAIALEEEELQAEMTSLEKRKDQRVQQQESDGLWDLHEQLRIKKRLLELRLAESGAEGASAGGAELDPMGAASGVAAPVAAPAAPQVSKTAKAADVVKSVATRLGDRAANTASRVGRHIKEEMVLHPKRTSALIGAGGMGALGATTGAIAGPHPGTKKGTFADKHPVLSGGLQGGIAGGIGGALIGNAKEDMDKYRRGGVAALRDKVMRTRALQAKGRDIADKLGSANAVKVAGAANQIKHVYESVKSTGGKAGAEGAKRVRAFAKRHPRSASAIEMGVVGAGLGTAEGALRKKYLEEGAKKHPDSKLWQVAAKHPKTYGALQSGGLLAALGAIAPVKHAGVQPSMFADEWGRKLAHADAMKAAAASLIVKDATEAGEAVASLMKEAAGFGALGTLAANFVRNPKNLGTVVGAGMGVAGGLASGLRKDEHGQRHLLSGLAQGAAGGATGALAGHAAQNIGSAVRGGASIGSAAKQYGQNMAGSAQRLMGGAATPGVPNAPARGTLGVGTPQLRRPSDAPNPLAAPDIGQFAKQRWAA